MSAAVKFNKLPVIFAIVMAGLLLSVGIAQCTRPRTVTTTAPTPVAVAQPTVPSRPSDADGEAETLRTMAAKLGAVEQVQSAQVSTDAKLEALNQQIAEVANNDSSDELLTALQQMQAQNQALTERLLALETKQATPADAAVNADLGIPAGAVPGQLGALTGAGISPVSPSFDASAAPSYVWIRPLDQPVAVDANGNTIAPALAATGEIEPVAVSAIEPGKRVTPRYTIPVNATLLNNRAMTAFIGRVPVNGVIPDGYRFKILASSEGLATNGFYLPPELKSMVFSGTASGDWNLSCVRGAIDSVTMTFEDGSVQTYGGDVATLEGTGAAPNRRALGYISDASGVPCIKGERVTNAPKVLTARFAAAAIEATTRGYAEAQTTNTVTAAGGVVRTIDDAAKFGLFNGLSGGAGDARAWLESRLGQIFDAVYAPPGANVAIHIESQINLDQTSDARLLEYTAQRRDNHALD